jgi:hypothetical protein
LRLQRVCLAPEGLACCASKLLRLEAGSLPIGIVHIDESFTDFCIIFRNKIIFVRSIPIGAQHLALEKERHQARFVEEIKRSLDAYQSEDIEKVPGMLILTGAVEELKEFEAILNNSLFLPSKVMPYFGSLTISNAALKAASLARHTSFLGVIAPLLSWDEMKIDLVPEEIKLKKSLEERGKDLIKSGIFVLAIFVLTFSILISKIYFKSAYLSTLDKKYQSLNDDADKLEKDFSQISTIKDYLSSRGYSLEVLTELYNITPLELELNDIRLDDQGKIVLKGTAESMSTVFSFVDSLEKSKYFRDAKTKYTSKRKEKGKDVTDFEIGAVLKKENEQ